MTESDEVQEKISNTVEPDPIGVGAGQRVPALQYTLIEPVKGRPLLKLREVWSYRDLIYLLVWRDIKVRYKQTVIGSSWAILQPLVTMVVFTLLFGRLMKVDTGEIPYPVFAFSALVPWTFFAHVVTKTNISLVMDRDLITNVYFPRLVIPVATSLAAVVDLLIALLMLFILMLIYGITPGASVVAIPLFMALAVATGLGVGLWLSVLNLQFRDVGHAIPFVLQIWLFLTPVAYPSSLIPENWRILYGLNPMTGVVEGFRWALVGKTWDIPFAVLGTSLLAVTALLIGGLYFFRSREPVFAEVA
jgi:lipopolysaccharide transport system permease protein